MSIIKIKKLLLERIGLNSGSIGESSIERAINQRMELTKVSGVNNYLTKLKNDSSEFYELVEEVVVPETWFFRNWIPFHSLSKCLPKSYKLYPELSSPLKILSVPCSTGEEPYSIAMCLLDNGFDSLDFTIDAIDISKRALIKARRAIYGKNSFREPGVNISDRFFRKSQAGSHLTSEVRDHVKFIQANIITDDIGENIEYYDIIYCRNLLIYFNPDTQKKVFQKLHLMLKPGGTLFVGHAEAALVQKNLFKNIKIPSAFAFRKINNNEMQIKKSVMRDTQVDKLNLIFDQLVKVTQKDLDLANRKINSTKNKTKSKIVVSELSGKWIKVDNFIKAGDLFEAASICQSILESQPEIANSYYYLGLINNLEGDVESADSLLKKAIYLDPNHCGALGLSATLAEKRGDDVSANSLRRREIRAKDRQ